MAPTTTGDIVAKLVAVMQPKLGDVIQDPAAGTGGFLIAAQHWIREHEDVSLLDEEGQKQFYGRTFYGMEHVQDTHRLALMNLMLHGLDSRPGQCGIWYSDTLSREGQTLPPASLILTNPPFCTKKGGGLPSRTDFTFPTSNKQFCFLQHIYRALKPGGRAAVVLPDNVLFEGNVGKQIREDLMAKCNLHTILRLPTGIFYTQGVKTNVLFFTRGTGEKGNTKGVGCTTCGRTCRPSANARRSPGTTSRSLRRPTDLILWARRRARPRARRGAGGASAERRSPSGATGRWRICGRSWRSGGRGGGVGVMEERELPVGWVEARVGELVQQLLQP